MSVLATVRIPSRRRYLTACFLAAAFARPLTTLAATDNWTNTAGGNFNGANWSPGLPGTGDIANFNLNATYTVTFTNSPTNSAVTFQQGKVTWNANGTAQTYNITSGLEVSGGALTLGSSGALLTVKTGVLSFDTSTSSLTVNSDSSLSTGTIDLAGDNVTGVNATINDNSTITQTGGSFLTIGSTAHGTGILNVNTGGIFTTGTNLTTIAATGQLNINGNGQFNLNGNLTVNGGLVNETNGALFWNTSGTTMTIQSGGIVNLVSENETPTNGFINISGAGSQLNDNGAVADLFIDNGGQLSATAGAQVYSAGYFDVAFVGNGTANFDGANTSLTATSAGNTIGIAGTGVLTFSNHASGTTGGFIIGQNAGSNGTLNVQSNATLSSGTITVASSANSAIGIINVSGGTLTMTGNSTLTVGAASTSFASVNISSGTLSTGTGLTTINPTGQIKVSGGTLNLNGNITLNDGSLVETSGTFNWAGNHTMTIQSGAFLTLYNQFTTPTNANITITSGSQMNLAGSGGGLTVANGAQINVTNGSSLNSTGTNGFDSGNGSITVDNSYFSASPGAVFGDSGTFSLTLKNNATSTVNYAYVGLSNGSSGTVNVQTAANLSIGGFYIGYFGQGETGVVNLSCGSINMTTGGAVVVGAASKSTASITISGGTFNTDPASPTTVNATGIINISGGTLNQNSDITINGGALTETTGAFNWVANHTMTIQSGGNVTFAGPVALPNNAIINISGAGSKLSDTGLDSLINNGGSISVTTGGSIHSDIAISNNSGNITVDGTGSTFTTAATPLAGGNLIGSTGTATVTFSNSATGNVTNGFAIGYNNATGTLNVQSSAVLTTGSLYVADDTTNGTGIVNVTGGTITQSGSAFVDLGSSSGTGSATLTIGTGGTFSTGIGLSTINAVGYIHLAGGTFNLNGDLTVSGGLLNESSGTFTWAANHNMTIQPGGGSAGDVILLGLYITPSGSVTTITGGGSRLQDTGSGAAIRIDGDTLTVNSGATLQSTGNFNVGVFFSATATFDGVNTTLVATSANSLIGDFTTAALTLSNNATGSLAGVNLGQASGGNGTLNMLSNSTLTLTSALVVAQNAVASTGLVNLSGGNLTLSGAAAVTVGATSLSTATVTINANSTLTTGTGLTTINATGHINLTGGIFNQNGNLTLAGGNLTQTGGAFNLAANQTLIIGSAGSVTLLNNFTTPANTLIEIGGTGSVFSDTGLTDRFNVDNGATVLVGTGGLLHSDEFLNIGSTGNASVTVDGAGSALTAGNAQSILGNAGNGTLTFSTSATGNIPNLTIGSQAGSVGTLNIQSNATLTTGVLAIATTAATATGTINITGGGSLQMTTGAALTVGAASTSSAAITIDTGGGFTTSAATTTINPTGKINLLNGSFNLNGNLTITGGSFTQNGGTFTWAASKTMTIQSGGKVTLSGQYIAPTNAVFNVSGTGSQLNDLSTGDLIINNGASLSVTSGASVHTDGFLDIASITGNGTATFDGANSSLTTEIPGSLLGTSGTGTLTFSNHATGNIAGYEIGTFFTSGGNGTLNVLSSATVTVTGAMNVGTFADVGEAFINVTGGTLTQTNNSSLTIGATANAIASVDVGSGGTYTTSTALTTINRTGALGIFNAGVFNLNGDLTVTGGSLNQFAGTFTWAVNHTMTIQSGGLVALLGTYFTPTNSTTTVTGAGSQLSVTGSSAVLGVDFGATLSVTNGASAHSDQFLSIADTGNGNVTVDGVGSSLSAAVSAANGTNSLGTAGTGSLTFSNSATGTVPGGFEIGFNTGSIGTLNVSSNASLTTGSISLANSGLNTIGILNVTGGTLTQTGTSSLIVGDISGAHAGAATLTIGLLGTLSTGTGLTNIAPTGTLNLQSGGTFLISSNVTNAGNLTLSGNHEWAPGTSLTNTAGKTIFTSNGRLYGLIITGGTVDTTTAKLVINPTNKSATLAALETDLYSTHSLLSSALPAHTALALIDNATLTTLFTTFGGQPANTSSILIAPELLGDTNIDGTVNATDLTTVLNHLGTTNANWTAGNFDGQPTIDLTDLNDVLNNLGQTYANSSGVVAPITPTPEPTSLAVLSVTSFLLIHRRRR
jgi:fibronectin-binding autotransporter adhesin